MKYLLSLLILLGSCLTVSAQTDNPDYDKILADSLGGDDYGMKSYILVLLKTGSNTTDNKILLDSLFKGHMENIGRMAKSGQLVIAGPMGKNDNAYRGIFILNVKTPEEAKILLESDPAVREKVLEAELYKMVWLGRNPNLSAQSRQNRKKKM